MHDNKTGMSADLAEARRLVALLHMRNADLVAQVAHWKANHSDMAMRNAILSQRPDLPVDRIPAYMELMRLQERVAQLTAVEFVAVPLDQSRVFRQQRAEGYQLSRRVEELELLLYGATRDRTAGSDQQPEQYSELAPDRAEMADFAHKLSIKHQFQGMPA